MNEVVEQIKKTIHSILGDKASDIFLGRVAKVLDDGAKDKATLTEACARIEKMVNLFIGTDEAKVIGSRCKEILNKLP